MEEIGGRRLERGSDRVLGGVCSGLAGYFSVDPVFVRIVFVLLALASGAGLVLYLVLWLFMPEAGEQSRQGDELGAGIRSVSADVRRIFGSPGRPVVAATGPQPQPPPPTPWSGPAPRPDRHHGGLWLGTLLILVGAGLLASSAGLLDWWNWAVMWPVLIICLGLLILARRLA